MLNKTVLEHKVSVTMDYLPLSKVGLSKLTQGGESNVTVFELQTTAIMSDHFRLNDNYQYVPNSVYTVTACHIVTAVFIVSEFGRSFNIEYLPIMSLIYFYLPFSFPTWLYNAHLSLH